MGSNFIASVEHVRKSRKKKEGVWIVLRSYAPEAKKLTLGDIEMHQ